MVRSPSPPIFILWVNFCRRFCCDKKVLVGVWWVAGTHDHLFFGPEGLLIEPFGTLADQHGDIYRVYMLSSVVVVAAAAAVSSLTRYFTHITHKTSD